MLNSTSIITIIIDGQQSFGEEFPVCHKANCLPQFPRRDQAIYDIVRPVAVITTVTIEA